MGFADIAITAAMIQTNTSVVADDDTARTSRVIAAQRAENILSLRQLGRSSPWVTELCVGPSARILYDEYRKVGIECMFNDIEEKWRKYANIQKRYSSLYTEMWEIGNCLTVSWGPTDVVVFAPPLSRGCSGRREDALMIDEVTPGYYNFLQEWSKRRESCWYDTAVLVLPARCLSTKEDRAQYHKLLGVCSVLGNVEAVEMIDGCRKYVDVYIYER